MGDSSTRIARAVRLGALALALLAGGAGAQDGPLFHTFVLGDPQIEPAGDSLKVVVPGIAGGGGSDAEEAGDRGSRNTKIIGCSLFSSGVFLCSWGISSWQLEEDQCCPARNTENVIKIIVGVVMVNAGLVYLLGGAD
jgi:hypothetical protein